MTGAGALFQTPVPLKKKNKYSRGQVRWCISVISGTWEVEIRKITV
jgi:hypothetical protein